MQFPSGKTVTGRITNTAINSGPVEIQFKDINGNAYTFVEGDRLVIYSIASNNRVTAKVVTVFQDNDEDEALDAGEELFVFSFSGLGFEQFWYTEGLASRRISATGENLFYAVASAAGEVDITILAEVIRA